MDMDTASRNERHPKATNKEKVVALLFSFMRGQHGRLGVRREPETGHINNTSDLSPPHSSDHFSVYPASQDRRIQKPDPALPRTRVSELVSRRAWIVCASFLFALASASRILGSTGSRSAAFPTSSLDYPLSFQPSFNLSFKTQHMSLAAGMRPSWLPKDLESLVYDCQFTVSINDLRSSRRPDDCQIVGELLNTVLQRLSPGTNPSEFELRFARHHLAVELQRILLRWCQEGLNKTLEASFSGMFSDVELPSSRKDMQFRPPPPPPFRHSSMTPSLNSPPGGQMSLFGMDPFRQQQQQPENQSLVPMKRPSEDDESMSSKTAKYFQGGDAGGGNGGEKDFRCPYYVRDPTTHPECANKRFPNPRKLKEHIWRFTKPFKCPTCNEGFGREKTKAIHCEQRKVKCIASDRNDYEGSLEQQRDRAIDRAKNTPEIIGIFEQYESNRRLSTTSVDSAFVSSPIALDNSERDISPDSDDPEDSLTPLAHSASFDAWLSPPPRRTGVPRLRIPIPQPTEKPGYPMTPPGDHRAGGAQFSPQQERGTLGSPFHAVPSVQFPEPEHYNDAMEMFPPTSAQAGGFGGLEIGVPQIVVHSPMTPVGFHQPQQFPEMDIMSDIDAHHASSSSSTTAGGNRITTLPMGPPAPPRQQQQQQHQHQFEGSMEGVQGEILSMGYGAIPPGLIRMKF